VAVHQVLMTMVETQFTQHYGASFVALFSDPSLACYVFRLQQTRRQVDSILALMILVSALERALGDYLAIVGGARVVVPRKLRQLIDLPTVSNALGAVCAIALKTLVGPLQAINLRNLLFHGFMRVDEYDPDYTSLLLVIALSMHTVVSVLQNVSHGRRPLTRFDQWDALLLEEMPTTQQQQTVTILPPNLFFIDPDNRRAIETLLANNYFVVPGHLEHWLEALALACNGQYWQSLMLLLPQMEHSLRRIYVSVNECSSSLWSAESDVLYSTLDVLLASHMPQQNIAVGRADVFRRNLLVPELGTPLMVQLLDALMYRHAPKMRDKLAHGDFIPSSVTVVQATHLWQLALALCAHYSLLFDDRETDLWARYCLQHVSSRRPLFHPQTSVKRSLMRSHEPFLALTKALHTDQQQQLLSTPTIDPTFVVKLQEFDALLQQKWSASFPMLFSSQDVDDGDNGGGPSSSSLWFHSHTVHEPFVSQLQQQLYDLLHEVCDHIHLYLSELVTFHNDASVRTCYMQSVVQKQRNLRLTSRQKLLVKNYQQWLSMAPFLVRSLCMILCTADTIIHADPTKLNEQQQGDETCIDTVRKVSSMLLHLRSIEHRWKRSTAVLALSIGMQFENLPEDQRALLSWRERTQVANLMLRFSECVKS
jgi:hypothetical protein